MDVVLRRLTLIKRLKQDSRVSQCQFHQHFSYKHCFSSFYHIDATRKSCRNNGRTKNLYVKCWWNWHLNVRSLRKTNEPECEAEPLSTKHRQVFRTISAEWLPVPWNEEFRSDHRSHSAIIKRFLLVKAWPVLLLYGI